MSQNWSPGPEHPDFGWSPGTEPMTPVRSARQGRKPLAPGQWSLTYDACQQCGTTERPHNGRGLCLRCYMRAYQDGEFGGRR